jgi:hypothetical protein
MLNSAISSRWPGTGLGRVCIRSSAIPRYTVEIATRVEQIGNCNSLITCRPAQWDTGNRGNTDRPRGQYM